MKGKSLISSRSAVEKNELTGVGSRYHISRERGGNWEQEGVKKIIRKGLVYICVIVGTVSTKGFF